MRALRPFFVAGFSALALQVLSHKLLTTAGLGDALSIAISLTLFVTLAGLGALVGERLSKAQSVDAEVIMGMYAIILFGSVELIGLDVYAAFWSGISGSIAVVVLALIVSPLAFLSGALIPAYEVKDRKATNFISVYGLFHVGGAVSLVLLEIYFTPLIGWPAVGALLGFSAVANALIQPKAMGGSTQGVGEYKGDHRIDRMAKLFVISVLTGIAGMASYKAADYLVGPNIRNYAIFTSAIFLGLGISSWIARTWTIRFERMVAITGFGLISVVFAALSLPYIIDAVMVAGSAWLAYGLALFVYGALTYALMGLSIPVAVQDGMSGAKAIFIVSIGNAVGYWTYLMMGEQNVDLYVLVGAGIALSALWSVMASISAATVLVVVYGFGVVSGGLHINIMTQNIYRDYAKDQDINRGEVEIKVHESWNKYGWPSERLAMAVDGEVVTDVFVINGMRSLSMLHPENMVFAESRVAMIPAVYANNHDQALVLGAGTGVSAGALTAIFNRTDVVDLNPSTQDALIYYSSYSAIEPEAVTLHQEEAMGFIAKEVRKGEGYDYLFSTVTGSGYTFSAALYTGEFFELSKKILNPGGVFAFWMDRRTSVESSRMILKGFRENFEHTKIIKVWPQSMDDAFDVPYVVVMGSDRELLMSDAAGRKAFEKLTVLNPDVDSDKDTFESWQDRLSKSEIRVCDLSDVEASSLKKLKFAYGYKTEIHAVYGIRVSKSEKYPFCFRTIAESEGLSNADDPH